MENLLPFLVILLVAPLAVWIQRKSILFRAYWAAIGSILVAVINIVYLGEFHWKIMLIPLIMFFYAIHLFYGYRTRNL